MSIRKRLVGVRQYLAQRKIERYSYLIAASQINGDFPEDMTEKELSEIALWDAIGRRVGAIVQQIQAEQGMTGIIDPSALAPREKE